MIPARKAIATIFRKEIVDILRDRRALVAAVVLPVLLYPFLIVGMTWLEEVQTRRLRESTVTVQLRGAEASPDLAGRIGSAENVRLVERPSPDRALREGTLDAIVDLEAAGRPDLEQTRVGIAYNGSLDTSVEALRRVQEVVQIYWQTGLDARLGTLGISTEDLSPIAGVPEVEDVGTGGGMLGRVLAMMLVVISLTGAVYPALDLGAGEKERRTLETILAAPVRRRDIVAGKYLATAAIAGVTALLSLLSMAGTFLWMASRLPAAPGPATSAGVGQLAIELSTVLALLCVLVPLVLLFSALALALSTFARTYKEAQSYVTPLLIGATIPAMASMAPGLELTVGWACVPVLGTVLLFRELLAGVASAGDLLLVFGANVAFAGAALGWAIRIYHEEGVLFRG